MRGENICTYLFEKRNIKSDRSRSTRRKHVSFTRLWYKLDSGILWPTLTWAGPWPPLLESCGHESWQPGWCGHPSVCEVKSVWAERGCYHKSLPTQGLQAELDQTTAPNHQWLWKERPNSSPEGQWGVWPIPCHSSGRWAKRPIGKHPGQLAIKEALLGQRKGGIKLLGSKNPLIATRKICANLETISSNCSLPWWKSKMRRVTVRPATYPQRYEKGELWKARCKANDWGSSVEVPWCKGHWRWRQSWAESISQNLTFTS